MTSVASLRSIIVIFISMPLVSAQCSAQVGTAGPGKRDPFPCSVAMKGVVNGEVNTAVNDLKDHISHIGAARLIPPEPEMTPREFLAYAKKIAESGIAHGWKELDEKILRLERALPRDGSHIVWGTIEKDEQIMKQMDAVRDSLTRTGGRFPYIDRQEIGAEEVQVLLSIGDRVAARTGDGTLKSQLTELKTLTGK